MLLLPRLVDLPRVQVYVTQAATQALGRPVRFERISVSALPFPVVRLRGLEVADDPRFGRAPLLRVEEGRFRLRLLPLLAGRVELVELSLHRVHLRVVEDQGKVNLLALAPGGGVGRGSGRPPGPGPTPSAAAGPPLSRLRISQGVVQLERRGAPAAPGGDLRLEAVDLAVVPRGDGVSLEGRAIVQPGAVRLTLSDGSITLAGRGPSDAAVRGALAIEAADAGPALARFVASPGVTGPIKGTLTLAGTLGHPTAQGELVADRIALTARSPNCGSDAVRQLPIRELRAPLALAPPQLGSAPVQARVANGTVRATVAFGWGTVPPRLLLKPMEVRGVQLGPVLVDFLCQAFAVTGPLDLTGEARLDPNAPTRTLHGAGRVRIGPGQVVGAAALDFLGDIVGLASALSSLDTPRAGGRRTPMAFDSVTATYTITNGVVRTDDLLYQSRDATVNVAGTYALTDTRVDLAVTLTQGRTQVKARVVGTTTPRALRVIPIAARSGEAGGVKRLLERMLR